jgi:AraC-like DNA-binding protein
MMYREIAPHTRLRKHIKCFWMLDHDYRGPFHTHEQLWADAHTELIFASGEPYFRKSGRRKIVLPFNFVIGPFQNELQLFSAGHTALVAVRFWPWGFRPLSKIPMADLKNTVRSQARVLAANDEALARELAAIENPEAKVARLERALLDVIGASHDRSLSRPVAKDILEKRGAIRIAELVSTHGIHARRLERIFLEEIGISPKIFARIVRFNHAMRTIERNPDIDLLALTYECDYADQAHFTRNFREMFGITPTQFKSRMQEAREIFRKTKADVVFVQDQPEDLQ